jgi:CspA family cold shock protein
MSDYAEHSPSGGQITASVKWFNPTKGFGFLVPDDGSPDVFCHISVVEQAGFDSLPQGATVTCEVSDGQKGPQVSMIQAVDTSTAQESPARSDRPRRPSPGGSYGRDRHDEPTGPTEEVDGTVKFFNGSKSYGFITPDGGGADVFIHAKVLSRAGLDDLEPQQRVRLWITQGPRGPQATNIELI